ITGFTLKVGSATGRIKWPFLTNETIVEAPIVYAKIPGYPGLWQLYNETAGVQLARPVDIGYLVILFAREHSVL
ncbi:MAG: hypothetical protein NO110_06870, partial [Sulfolobales archaeon]|nr:hypothetical protein [Sulfolobales archaeon]